MILWLYSVLLLLSVAMICIGIFRPDESVYAIVGFVFLFYLGFLMSQGNLEYSIGNNVTYETSGTTETTTVNTIYTNFTGADAHFIGYFLAVGSALGFVVILIGLRGLKAKEDD